MVLLVCNYMYFDIAGGVYLYVGYKETFENRGASGYTNPEIILMLNATIAVLKAKDIIACNNAIRRIAREDISTSDTWNVIPITKEK